MADFLMRDEAPLSPEQWETIDRLVGEVASRVLVGRRFIPIFGPLGVGTQTVVQETFAGTSIGAVDLMGSGESNPLEAQNRAFLPLPMIYKDFRLHWRDVEASQPLGLPLDLGAAAGAAAFTARAEDSLVFNGNKALGQSGLLTAAGSNRVPMGEWGQSGKAFDDAIASIDKLTTAGFCGPYAMVLSPRLYAGVHRVYANTGVLEIEQIRKLITDGVYQTPVVPEPTAIVVATGAENMDLAIAQDLVTAFLQTDNMDHYFRVLESLALRIKSPGAICIIG